MEHYTTGENHAQGYLREIATDPNADRGLAPQRLSSLCDQPSSQEHSTAKAKVGNLTLESRAFGRNILCHRTSHINKLLWHSSNPNWLPNFVLKPPMWLC